MNNIWFKEKQKNPVLLKDARISAMDRGFLYCDQIIETMYIYNHRVHRFYDHINRLTNSAKALGIDFKSYDFSIQELKSSCSEIIKNLSKGSGVLRLTITFGSGLGIYKIIKKNQLNYYLICYNIHCNHRNKISNPNKINKINLVTHNYTSSALSTIKTGNYQAAIAAFRNKTIKTKNHKNTEILWISEKNYIIETATANIFFVKKTTSDNQISSYYLYTPNDEYYFLKGLTRDDIISVAKKLNINIKITTININCVYKNKFIAAFICSSIRGISVINSINKFEFNYDKKINEFIANINKNYHLKVDDNLICLLK